MEIHIYQFSLPQKALLQEVPAEGAIKQIKDKKYFESLEEYQDNLLLIGINYDKKTKEHVCKIEKY